MEDGILVVEESSCINYRKVVYGLWNKVNIEFKN